MTDINLKDFDKNNWDEFVHLRALKDVINQENAINNEQNQQIAQNTNDVTTAKQEAEDAKNTAESAENTANEAKTTADGLNDKVDTAQSTAEDAKNTADEAKTSADNAGKVAGMAQNTATQASNEVNELNNSKLDKPTLEPSNLNDAGIKVDFMGDETDATIYLLPVPTANSIVTFWSGSLLYSNIPSANINTMNNQTLTFSQTINDKYFTDGFINCTVYLIDVKTGNKQSLSIPARLDKDSDTTCNIQFLDWADEVIKNYTSPNSASRTAVQIIFNDIF